MSEWRTITVNVEGERQRKVPCFAVKKGTVEISAAACDLLPDEYRLYRYASFLKKDEENLVAIHLLKEPDGNGTATAVTFKNQTVPTGSGPKVYPIKCIVISNKALVKAVFGEAGIAPRTTKYPVRYEEGFLICNLDDHS